MVLRMVGASDRVRWSSLRASRSDSRRAVDSMLRRSWLILLVAAPTSASRDFCRSEARSSRCRLLVLAVDHADLVVAPGRRALRPGLFRRAAERRHVGRQVLQRQDDQPAQREVEQGGGEQRDDDGQHQDARGVAVHRDAHRQLVDDDPHHGMRQAHRFAADADVARAVMRHRRQRVPDQLEHALFLEVVARHAGARLDGHQGALGLVGLDQHHGIDPRVVEQRALDLLGHHVVGRGIERQRRQGAALDQLLEIDHAEAGDRGQEEQDLGRHHRGDHQPQDAQRQAEGGISATQGADRFGRRGDIGGHCRSLSESALPA